MQKFLLSAILFFLVLITFALFFFFYETQYFGSKASMTIVDVSTENTYVVINPGRAQADGKDKIRVTIFVLNSQGLGVPNREVIMGVNPSLVATNVQDTTDTAGEAIFEYNANAPGEYYLDIKIHDKNNQNADITLPQKAKLSFYE